MDFYTIEEIALILKLDPSTVRRFLKRGYFPHYKIGRQIRIKKDHFEEYLKNAEKKG